jgi:hypothetical protein
MRALQHQTRKEHPGHSCKSIAQLLFSRTSVATYTLEERAKYWLIPETEQPPWWEWTLAELRPPFGQRSFYFSLFIFATRKWKEFILSYIFLISTRAEKVLKLLCWPPPPVDRTWKPSRLKLWAMEFHTASVKLQRVRIWGWFHLSIDRRGRDDYKASFFWLSYQLWAPCCAKPTKQNNCIFVQSWFSRCLQLSIQS